MVKEFGSHGVISAAALGHLEGRLIQQHQVCHTTTMLNGVAVDDNVDSWNEQISSWEATATK